MKVPRPTYSELLKITKLQELEIQRYRKREKSISNSDFFFKESLDLVCIAGFDGFYKVINHSFNRILGYTKKELLGNSLLTFVHPDDFEKSKKELESLSQGSTSSDFENRLITKNGSIVYFEWTYKRDFSENNIYAIGKDITKLKKAAIDLQESKALLENAQKLSKTGSWEFNYLTNTMIWSDELYSIYGVKKKKNQNLFQEYVNRFSKSDVKEFLNKIETSRIDQKPFEVEQCTLSNKKKVKWVYATVFPIVDEKGEVIGLRGNTQDITVKRQNREILQLKKQAEIAQKIKIVEDESNKKFKSYIENAPDGIIVVDEKGQYIEVNHAAVAMSGYTEEELLKKSIYDLLISDSRHNLDYFFQILKEVGSVKGEIKTKIKSGEIRWRSISAVKLSETRFVAFVKDITDIKLANDIITSIFDRISDAFMALNNDWCYTYMNHKAGEILNRKPEEMIGKNIWTQFPNSINGKFYNQCHQSLKNQEHIHFEEFNSYNNRWIESTIYPSVDGLSIFFRDITKEKTAKEKVKESEKRFRALLENNNEIIIIIDPNMNLLFRSSSVTRITGWTLNNSDSVSTLTYIHPDFVDYLSKKMEESLAQPNAPIPVLFRLKHKDGHYIWLEGFLNNKIHDKNIKGFISNLRDVSSQIKANQTLSKERDIFTKIAATSPGLIYSMRQNLDGSFCYPYASDVIKEIYGFSFEEIKNNATKIFNQIHPEDFKEVMTKLLNTKKNLVPLKGEYRYFHPTKGLVWHEVNSLPVLESEGTVICHGITTDITERIEVKQKLLKVSRLYLFISQINQMIVRTKDQETLFKEACNIAVDIGEFKMAWLGLIDSNDKNIYPVIVTSKEKQHSEIIENIITDKYIIDEFGPAGTAIKEGIYHVCNDIANHKKGIPWRDEALQLGYQSVISLPLKKFETIFGVFTLYAGEKNFFDAEEIDLLKEASGDIAFALELFDKERLKEKAEREVVESEIRYHTLTEYSPVGIFRTDATGYTTFVNPSWCKISGLSFEEAIGNGWLNAVHEEDKIALAQGWEKSSNIGEISLSEYRFVRHNGSIAWVMGQAIPEINEKNEVTGYVGTITDITDRKALENQMMIAKEEAETANKSKSNFLANMSHEIRTPLNGIIGFTHLLMKTELNDNQFDYMSTVNESAASLLEIVNDVLDFSKIESGKLELHIEEVDLYKVISQIIDLFKYQSINKNINFVFNIDKNVSQYILADSIKIKQIVVNLLSNALKFTEFGEIRLDVTEEQSSKKNYATIKFSVKDTGIGIKPNNHKKIFSSFEQEDNSTSRKFGGTGLGLTISNQLLELMGSKLQLSSIYGKGSNFYFTINVKKFTYNKNIKSKQVNHNTDNKISIFENKDPKKILIVEDNQINMLLVKTLIKKLIPNSIIISAFDGNESVEQFLKEQPDLILMDIQMPNKNGYEATIEIRKLEALSRTPIIAVTAGIFTGEKEKCFEIGMDDYLPKPIVINDLENIILKWLKK